MKSRVRTTLVQMVDDALGDDPKKALVAAVALQGEVKWLLQRAVARARAENWDWGRISRLLGVSRQAARQKFRVIVPLGPPHTRRISDIQRQMRDGMRLTNEIRDRARNRDDDDPVAW
ncbi:MAG: hypothetical protein KGR47_04860 [Acidobacteria bacterium]|nr:hypothetical protein [Acidobacteriota bacterium]